MEELINDLNDSQKEAVLYNSGPSLVIAGAGSGKTRVLTRKIAYLLSIGLPPWSIMALTFTNKAAREMKNRIAILVNEESAKRLWMGTFHSIFLKILRSEHEALGYQRDFTIYDTSDSKSLVKSIIKEMNLDDKQYKVSTVLNRISNAKNMLVSPEAYRVNKQFQSEDAAYRRPLIREIYKRYSERCRIASAMDFDDILYYTNVLFRDNPQILDSYQDRFKFILVDEYQDTNFAQYLIIKKLAEKHHNICAVGDDSQSIYSFRGANIENILNFKNTYPEGKLFKLEQNYRSTKSIVNAANSLIEKNRGRIKKVVFSKNAEGDKIKVLSAYSDLEEGFIIANKINEIKLREFYNYNDFAILYRTNAQSRIFEESLRKRNIPYRVYGGLSFYQRKEIKDIIAYLRIVINPNDEEALKRVINYPSRGIGTTTVNKLLEAAHISNAGIWDILSDPLSYDVKINNGTLGKINYFRSVIEPFFEILEEKNVFDIAEGIIENTGMMEDLRNETRAEANNRRDNMNALLSGMNDFCNGRLEEGNDQIYVRDYLSEVSLLTDQDEDKGENEDKVTMMTIHAAKGLEFKNIFVVGLEEDTFPSSHCTDCDKDLEEERRLLYVAITRAEDHCILSYAKSRFKNGITDFTKPSRFLKDFDNGLLDMPLESAFLSSEQSYSKTPLWGKNQANIKNKTDYGFEQKKDSFHDMPFRKLKKVSNLSSTTNSNTKVLVQGKELLSGMEILHDRFGKGIIKSINGEDDSKTINVDFENTGNKKLLLKFAKFKILK